MTPNITISPSENLEFSGPFDAIVKQTLEITNHTSGKVAFKVKTTAPKAYCVRPNSGLINPNASIFVSVLLQPIAGEVDTKAKDKFLVQVIKVEEGQDVDGLWTKAEALKKQDPKGIFFLILGTIITELKLKCLLLEPSTPQPPSISKDLKEVAAKEPETKDLQETIKRLTSACEGYKMEIERLNQLRLRKGESTSVKEKSNAVARSDGGISLIMCALFALIAFIVGYVWK